MYPVPLPTKTVSSEGVVEVPVPPRETPRAPVHPSVKALLEMDPVTFVSLTTLVTTELPRLTCVDVPIKTL